MADPAALQRLFTWLSPAFPVGTFAWSQGLETAITEERVTDAAALKDQRVVLSGKLPPAEGTGESCYRPPVPAPLTSRRVTRNLP